MKALRQKAGGYPYRSGYTGGQQSPRVYVRQECRRWSKWAARGASAGRVENEPWKHTKRGSGKPSHSEMDRVDRRTRRCRQGDRRVGCRKVRGRQTSLPGTAMFVRWPEHVLPYPARFGNKRLTCPHEGLRAMKCSPMRAAIDHMSFFLLHQSRNAYHAAKRHSFPHRRPAYARVHTRACRSSPSSFFKTEGRGDD